MLADRYEQRDGTGIQCAYQCVQYCVDENFDNRGVRSMSIGKRQRHRLEINHVDFQKALNAVWAAGKGCRREPMSYNPPEAIRLSLRAEIDARAIVWQPRNVPTHKHDYFHGVVKYFVYEGSWSLSDSTWEHNADCKGAIVVFGSKPGKCSTELIIIRSDRWLFFDEFGLFEAGTADSIKNAKAVSGALRATVSSTDTGLASGALRATKSPVVVDATQEPSYVHFSNQSDLVVEEAHHEFYRRAFERKQWQAEVQDAAGGTAGGNHFSLESTLRVKILSAQRADPGLTHILNPLLKPAPKGAVKVSDATSQAGYRMAVDGVLEKSVSTKGGQTYVPVIPDGDLGTNATWKWW